MRYQFTSSQTTVIVPHLPPRRYHSSFVKRTSALVRHTARDEQVAPVQQAPTPAEPPLPVFPPFDPSQVDLRTPRLQDLTPTSRSCTKLSISAFRIQLATENPWPSDMEMLNLVKVSCVEGYSSAPSHLQRFQVDGVYNTYISKAVSSHHTRCR